MKSGEESDDISKSIDIPVREKEIAANVNVKEHRLKLLHNEDKARPKNRLSLAELAELGLTVAPTHDQYWC